VIGVNDYADEAFPSLKWAENDAIEVERILEDPQYGGFDRVISLTGPKQARRDRVLSEMISLKNDLRRQDTLVVYVSSHGTMTIDAAGSRSSTSSPPIPVPATCVGPPSSSVSSSPTSPRSDPSGRP
jgi:hypothetical protein